MSLEPLILPKVSTGRRTPNSNQSRMVLSTEIEFIIVLVFANLHDNIFPIDWR